MYVIFFHNCNCNFLLQLLVVTCSSEKNIHKRKNKMFPPDELLNYKK